MYYIRILIEFIQCCNCHSNKYLYIYFLYKQVVFIHIIIVLKCTTQMLYMQTVITVIFSKASYGVCGRPEFFLAHKHTVASKYPSPNEL